MTSIKINLHDFNEEVKRVQIQKQVVSAASIVVVALVLMGIVWLIQQQENLKVQEEIDELDSQISALESQYRVVKKMQKKTKRINQIIAGIKNLRNNQTQPAKLLENINQLIPEEIWLEHVEFLTKEDVIKKGVKYEFEGGLDEIVFISGAAIKPNIITQYIESLKESPFFKSVYLKTIFIKILGANRAWEFQIYCHRV